MTTQTLFQTVYSEIIRGIKNVSIPDLVTLSVNTINSVERYRISGPDKKALVLRCMETIINDSEFIRSEDRRAANIAVQFILPAMIDQIVNAANGGLSNFSPDVQPGYCIS